jgi:hypothetical protein
MLQEFNLFAYEMKNIYFKEINTFTILNYISTFYNKFLSINYAIEDILLHKTAQAIIIAMDDILLQNKTLKNEWIKNTGENYLFHTNRGGEIFNNIIEDILTKRIFNYDSITIIITCILMGAQCNKKTELITFYKNINNYYTDKLQINLQKISIQKNKPKEFQFLKFFFISFFILLILIEIIYIFYLSYYVKETNNILLTIRGYNGL